MPSKNAAFTYCCKNCGFDLNLRPEDRNPEGVMAKLWHAVGMGSMSFARIDLGRFSQVGSWGQSSSSTNCDCDCCCCYQYAKSSEKVTRKTKLLCPSCRRHVGIAASSTTLASVTVGNASGVNESKSGVTMTIRNRYNIMVGSVRPSTAK